MEKVVVWVTLSFEQHPETHHVIGRCKEFNLHAHGVDRAAAMRNLQYHFRFVIEALRETNELEGWLKAAGVDWMTYSDAVAADVAFIDLRPDEATDPTSPHYPLLPLVEHSASMQAAA